jgi:hypothetical protein
MKRRLTTVLVNLVRFDRSDFRFFLVVSACLVGFFVGYRMLPVPAAADPVALKVQGADTIGNPIQVLVTPPGAGGTAVTMLAQSSANAASTNNISLAAAANQTTYCTGFQITGAGATAGSVILVTLTGVVIQTQNYQLTIPTGAVVGVPNLIVTFNPPLPASAVNTAITLNVPSFGAGNTNAAAAIQGFRQ